MSNISFFKKLSIFRDYRKVLKLNKVELEQTLGARVDSAWRIYNVINIPIEEVGEPYNLRKSDIDLIAERLITEYTKELSSFLNKKGLQEMYEYYEIKKVEKYSYLIVVGFSLPGSPFRSNIYYNNIYYKIVPTVLALLTISYFLFI